MKSCSPRVASYRYKKQIANLKRRNKILTLKLELERVSEEISEEEYQSEKKKIVEITKQLVDMNLTKTERQL